MLYIECSAREWAYRFNGKLESISFWVGVNLELIIVVIVTILAAIIGALIWPIFGSRIQRPTAHMLRANDDESLIQRVLDFYIDRIEYEERVPPSFLRFFLFDSNYSVYSIDKLPYQCSVSTKPIHVLLYVSIGKQIVGTCKLIYICNLSSFFIAYYAARPNEKISSTEILSAMMDYLSPHIDQKHNLYYEICDDRSEGNSHIAKARLFRHYAQSRGFHVKTLVENYLQPEISAFEGEFAPPIQAKLFELSRGPDTSSRFDKTTVVNEIFEFVYLDSFTNADPEAEKRYLEYLTHVKNLMIIGKSSK